MSDDLLQNLPALRGESRGRTIYVDRLDPEVTATLKNKGYEAIELFTLPRNEEQDKIDFLYAKAQAIEEGTIPSSQKDIRALELEMRAHGLLDKQTRNINLNANLDAETTAALFGWGSDRHTLSGNSTVVTAQLPAKAKDPEKN